MSCAARAPNTLTENIFQRKHNLGAIWVFKRKSNCYLHFLLPTSAILFSLEYRPLKKLLRNNKCSANLLIYSDCSYIWALKIRFCTWIGAIQVTNTDWAENGLRAGLRRRTWGCWLMRSSTWPSHVCLQPRKPNLSRAVWSASQGRWF